MYNGNRFKNMRGDLNWYAEDNFFEGYPLSKEEENKYYQEFKKLKAKKAIPFNSEYHDWKLSVGLPKRWANYFNGMNYSKKPSQWIYDKKLMTQYYKEEYLKEWKGEDISPKDLGKDVWDK